ncbi:hypothetical protein AVEN_124338-1, partial [Araneus ventricosus]
MQRMLEDPVKRSEMQQAVNPE